MQRIQKKLKQIDVFGYPISLKYKNKGNTFKTWCGASTTILTICVIFALLSLLVVRMVNHQQDFISVNEQQLDLKKQGFINYNQTNLQVFQWLLKDQIRQDLPIQELRNNIDIYYKQDYEDWNNNVKRQRRVEIKWCTQDYFGYDAESENIWNSWNNTLIICPDFQQGDGFQLFDDGLNMEFQQINIVFEKCNTSAPGNTCNSDEKINQFLQDLQIITYTLQYNTDFEKYNQPPVYKYQNIQSIIYPNTSVGQVQVDNLYLRKNYLTTQDDFLQYGQISQEISYYDVQNSQQYNAPLNFTDTTFAKINLQLASSFVKIQRKVYSIQNLLSDLGGVTNSLLIIFALILEPISYFSFTLNLLRNLFKDKLKSQNCFNVSQGKLKAQNKFSTKDQILLFLSLNGCKCIIKHFWTKLSKFEEFFQKGSILIDENLNILNILKFMIEYQESLKVEVEQNSQKKDFKNICEPQMNKNNGNKDEINTLQKMNETHDQLNQIANEIELNIQQRIKTQTDPENHFETISQNENMQQQYAQNDQLSIINPVCIRQKSKNQKIKIYKKKDCLIFKDNVYVKNQDFEQEYIQNGDILKKDEISSLVQNIEQNLQEIKNIQKSVPPRQNIFAIRKRLKLQIQKNDT